MTIDQAYILQVQMWKVLKWLKRQSRECLDPPSIMLRLVEKFSMKTVIEFTYWWYFDHFKILFLFRSKVKKAQRVRRTWSEPLPSQAAFPHTWVMILIKMTRKTPPYPLHYEHQCDLTWGNVIENHHVLMRYFWGRPFKLSPVLWISPK